MDQPTLNSILLAILAAAMSGLFAVWFRTSGRRELKIDSIITRLEAIEKANVGYDIKLVPLWAKAQKDLSETLHHPHAKDQEADQLLDKLERHPGDMTEEETDRLKNLMLLRSMDASVSFKERRAATIMPLVMDMVFERDQSDVETVTESVAVDVQEAPKE